MNIPSVSVVIPTYNNENTILPLIKSVKEQSVCPEEIIVVDDCSTDKTASLAEDAGCTVLRNQQNAGPSVSRNKGAEQASSEIICFLDSDITLDSDAIKIIKEYFRENKETKAIVGGMKACSLNSGWVPNYKSVVENSWLDKCNEGDLAVCINARVGAVRKDAFFEFGGFDDVYIYPSVEDYELGLRFSKKYDIVIVPSLQAWHHFPAFIKLCRNYYDRTCGYLELQWLMGNCSKADNGGTSVANALEFLTGALALACLPFLGSRFYFIYFIIAGIYIVLSYKTLKFHLAQNGPFFYAFCLILHAILGAIVLLAGVKSVLFCKLLGRYRFPIPKACRKSG